MATPFLGADINTNPFQVLRALGATFANFGQATITGPYGAFTTLSRAAHNPVVRHNGFLYMVIGTTFYKSRDDGETWETVYASGAGGLFTDQRYFGGIHKVYVNGEPYLVSPYSSPGTVCSYVVLDRTETGANYVTANSHLAFSQGVCVGGSLLWHINGGGLQSFNPATGTITTYSGFGGVPFSLCWWNGDMYGAINPGTNMTLYRFSGGVSTLIDTVTNIHDQGQLFVDPVSGDLILLASDLSVGGVWKCYAWDTALTRTEITGTVLSGTPWPTGNNGRLHAVYPDQEDAGVETSPRIYLMWSSTFTAGTPYQQWRWNGKGAVITLQDSGGDIEFAAPNGPASASQRFWTARSPGVDLTPNAEFYGNGALIIAGSAKQVVCDYPRSQIVASSVPAATYDLSTQALTNTPIKPGSVTIRGVVGATVEIAQDDGAGAFPTSTLLPAGGTINYSTGAMTGTTASLDASTDVEALYSGGTCTLYVYRTAANDAYQTDANANQASILTTSHGAIDNTGDGPKINNVPCDGTVVTIGIDMSAFTVGDRVSFQLWAT